MHSAVLVIGDDPQARTADLCTPLGTADWLVIGGRYAGMLIPVAAGDTRGPGVDQLRAGQLDLAQTEMPAYLLDADGVLHEPGFSDDDLAVLMGVRLVGGGPPGEEQLEQIEAKLGAWEVKVEGLIRAAGPAALLTVVDVHT